MKQALLIAAAVFLAPLVAHAQEPQAITLTPQEYNAVLMQIANRDPVLALLMRKQDAAQLAAQKAAEAQKPATPAPVPPAP